MSNNWIFANCILVNAPKFSLHTPNYYFNSVTSMHTPGILELLNGQKIYLCEQDRRLFYKTVSPEFIKIYPTFDYFNPIEINFQDSFVWTPLPDIVIHMSFAKNQNNQQYWYNHDRILEVFGKKDILNIKDLENYYHQLNKKINCKTKIIILYSYDNMPNTKNFNNLWKPRMIEIHKLVKHIFKTWKFVEVEKNPEPHSDKHWSHYSVSVCNKIALEVETIIKNS